MNQKLVLPIALIILSISVLAGCQPETVVQNAPSPTSDLPKLPTVAAVTASSQATSPTAEVASSEPEPEVQTTTDPGFGEKEANIPPNETPAPFVEFPPAAESLVALARTDLAEELGVAEDEITVVSVAAVVWPDGSLGCPQPGMEYAQVLTPGFQILLSYKGVESEYHSDEVSTVVRCVGDFLRPLPTMPFKPGDIKDGEPWMPVD